MSRSIWSVLVLVAVTLIAIFWAGRDEVRDGVHPDADVSVGQAASTDDATATEDAADAEVSFVRSTVSDAGVEPEGIDGLTITGRVVGPRGEILQSEVRVTSGERSRVAVTSAAGHFEMAVPKAWSTGEVAASHGRSVASVSYEVVDGADRVDVGTLVVRPIVELHLGLQVEPGLQTRVPALAESQITVYAIVPSEVVGMTIPQRHEIHEFRNVHEDGRQSKTLVVPAELIGTDGYLKLLWIVNNADLLMGSILRQETLDAAAERLESTLVLGGSSVLTGVVSCKSGERLEPLRLSVLTTGAGMTIRLVVTSAIGQFALFVPENSSGVVWPNLLGQVSEVAWSAGAHLEFEADFSSFVRVQVVDEAGSPVARCKISSANVKFRGADGSLENDERTEPPSPDGVHLYPGMRLVEGSLMFLVLPGPRQFLHRYREANRKPDLSYRIAPDSIVPADASIRVVVVSPAGADPASGLEVLLKGPMIDERRRIEYRLLPTSSDWRAQQIFAGGYDYEVHRESVVVATGSITVDPGEEARLDLRL